jgi:hypothetical protein
MLALFTSAHLGCYDMEPWYLIMFSRFVGDGLWSSQSLDRGMKSHVGSSLLQLVKKYIAPTHLGSKCNCWGTHQVSERLMVSDRPRLPPLQDQSVGN